MTRPVISVEHLTKKYDLGVIGTGTLSRDLERWWARVRHQPDPYTRIGQEDAFKRYGESILALDDVSFTVEQGETLGIIGRNGAGKSTLLKILSRVTAPTSGEVKVKGRIGSLLEVGTGFHPELTGRENVYLNGAILGMKKAEVARKFDEIVEFSGVEKFIDTPVKRYSSGMYVRLAFAVAAHLDPEILIVDEVLAVGDAEFQKKCLGKMGDVAGEGRTVLFVSHNMAAIENLCEDCIYLSEGKLAAIGKTEKTIQNYLSSIIIKSESKKVEDYRSIVAQRKIIKSIKALDSNFAPRHQFKIGEKIIIEITFLDEIKPSVSPFLGIGINNTKDVRIVTLMSFNDMNHKSWLSCRTIRCELTHLTLVPGQYYVKVALNFGDLEKDTIVNFPLFEIIASDYFETGKLPGPSQGVIVYDSNWNYLNE